MRVSTFAKMILVAGAVALPTSFSVSANAAKLPPGACAVGKKAAIANAAACSFQCNPTTGWCSQQMCVNGQLVQVLSCYGTFCSAKCG
jgi:hypothetical protein